MVKRSLHLPEKNSFFLFGARGTGKTHLLKDHFKEMDSLYLDLLDPDTQQNLSLRPSSIKERFAALPRSTKWVLIDEIQKIPALLDVVHQQIESTDLKFALTGSSARKLKYGGANLLAGRAFVHHLFPLTSQELRAAFNLDAALRWGTLPRILSLPSDSDKRDYLRSYTHSYLQEEITQEQVIRKLDPFRRFLFVAAQMSGQPINFSKISRDTGASVPTVQSYFQILEDTLIGFLLEPFHESVRKRQRESSKFYFFDTGVLHALQNTLTVELLPQTSAYGTAFEHFVINEIQRIQSYEKKDFQLSYLRTKDGVEIDLVIERPGRPRALIEIKSTDHVGPDDIAALKRLGPDISNSESFCLSRDPISKKIEGVLCHFWREGIERILS